MASKFWLTCAAWLCCDFCGYRYGGQQYNGGIGLTLFATVCSVTVGWDVTNELPPSDTGYKIIAFSMLLWPGFIWGSATYTLLSGAEDQAACVWLILSPLFVALLGLPILAEYHISSRGLKSKWRITVGLSWLGILTGHFLSRSRLGHMVEHLVTGLWAKTLFSSALPLLTGVGLMLLSVSQVIQSHSKAYKLLQLAKKIPTDTIIPFDFPPLWGVQGPACVTTWLIGLALCISSLDDAQARATLGSLSVAVVLPMAFFPPFTGQIWGIRYQGFMRLFYTIHVSTVLSLCLYYHVLVRAGSAHASQDTVRMIL